VRFPGKYSAIPALEEITFNLTIMYELPTSRQLGGMAEVTLRGEDDLRLLGVTFDDEYRDWTLETI